MTVPEAVAPLAGGARAAGAYVDLHSHSTASDGLVEPAAVVEAAHRAGLVALALTDHDTVDGVAAARAAGERLGVRIVAGAELSAHVGSEEIHLLALHLDDVAAVAGALARFRDDRVARAEKMVALLNARGVAVSMDDVQREAAGGAVGRPHVARAVVAAGGARDVRDAFDRFLGNGRPANVEKPRLDAADAIRLVHEAGGIAVWAHPGPEARRDRVEPLVAAGLDGLEVLHPRHGAEDEARLGALVDFFGLVSSGGSDWHGTTDGYRVLGQMQVPLAVLEAQDARVARLRRAGAR
ncbi:MAG TPA: PHP domain-containing protein [Gemmatirosa sp.]|nr:PHP domain-containing protein [Gemmatirosa sp.]